MNKYICSCDNKTEATHVLHFSYECQPEVACKSCADKHLLESQFNKVRPLTEEDYDTFDPNEMKQPDWK